MANAPSIDHYRHFTENWLGHRKLTRRIVEAVPEGDLFSFSVGGMRTPAELAHEILESARTVVTGVATGDFPDYRMESPYKDRAALLTAMDEEFAALEKGLRSVTEAQLATEFSTFGGSYTGTGMEQLQYAFDNEIHHRGQLYVYLRALGVEPVPFWDR